MKNKQFILITILLIFTVILIGIILTTFYLLSLEPNEWYKSNNLQTTHNEAIDTVEDFQSDTIDHNTYISSSFNIMFKHPAEYEVKESDEYSIIDIKSNHDTDRSVKISIEKNSYPPQENLPNSNPINIMIDNNNYEINLSYYFEESGTNENDCSWYAKAYTYAGEVENLHLSITRYEGASCRGSIQSKTGTSDEVFREGLRILEGLTFL